jgi:Major intrinsic protein
VSSWERLGVEMILTFVVVFTYFVSTNTPRKIFGNSAAMIGAAYSACNFVSVSFSFASWFRVVHRVQVENTTLLELMLCNILKEQKAGTHDVAFGGRK